MLQCFLPKWAKWQLKIRTTYLFEMRKKCFITKCKHYSKSVESLYVITGTYGTTVWNSNYKTSLRTRAVSVYLRLIFKIFKSKIMKWCHLYCWQQHAIRWKVKLRLRLDNTAGKIFVSARRTGSWPETKNSVGRGCGYIRKETTSCSFVYQ